MSWAYSVTKLAEDLHREERMEMDIFGEPCVVPAIQAASECCACQQHRLPNKLINFRKKAVAKGFHTCKDNQV